MIFFWRHILYYHCECKTCWTIRVQRKSLLGARIHLGKYVLRADHGDNYLVREKNRPAGFSLIQSMTSSSNSC